MLQPPAIHCEQRIGQPAHKRHSPRRDMNCIYCGQKLITLEFGDKNYRDPQQHTYRKRHAVALTIIEWP